MKYDYRKWAWIICFTGWMIGCQSEPPAVTEEIRPVRSERVMTTGGTLKRTFSGTARAGTEIKLSFRIGGTITQIPVKVGQKVKKGDFIASLDPADLQLQFEQTLSQENNAKIQMQTAQANLDRVRGLYENNNVALSEYESAKNSFAASKSQYETARKATNLQRSQLSYGKLYAPMDGFIGAVSVSKNENVASGNAIAVLNSQDDLEISIGVPETLISRIKVGDEADVAVSALKGTAFKGVVAEVSFSIDQNTFTYPVNIRIVGERGQLRPGMAADVSLVVSSESGSSNLVISAAAVAEDQNGRHVFVLEPGEGNLATVRRREVKLGELSDAGFVVLEGLEEGLEIVTAGVNKITDGLVVRRME